MVHLSSPSRGAEDGKPLSSDERFFEWQISARQSSAQLQLLAATEKRELSAQEQARLRITGFGTHIATLATISDRGVPNTASKGVLLLPTLEHLDWAVAGLGQVLEAQYGSAVHTGAPLRPEKERWDAAAEDRARFLAALYTKERIDRRRVGVLEIFKRNTLHNVMERPRCVLHFVAATGERGRGYLSYQLECDAAVVREGLELEFMKRIKLVMDHYGSHIPQSAYQCGLLLSIAEVVDKAPIPAHAHRAQ